MHLSAMPPPPLIPSLTPCPTLFRLARLQAVAWVTAEQLLKGAYAMPPADEPLLPAVLAVMRAHRAAATERAASLGVPGGWEI